jgi:GNAT superfamily N-acetyltransferase
MHIRPALSADLPRIERIVHAAYARYIPRIGKPPGPMGDDYAARIRAGSVWVAGDHVDGVVVLLDAPGHLLLDNVAVDPDAQGKGIGRLLIAFAEAEARRRGHAELRLYTHQLMTENIALYARTGWEETGRGEQGGFARVFFRKRLST